MNKKTSPQMFRQQTQVKFLELGLATLPVILSILALLWQAKASAGFKFEEVPRLRSTQQFECLFLGDTYFGETYQKKRNEALDPFLDLSQTAGYEKTSQSFKKILEDSDLNIANFEGSLSNQIVSPLEKEGKEYIHKGQIHETPHALSGLKIDIVSLANNHSMDFGMDGLRQTQKLLTRNEIKAFGIGKNQNRALAPYLFKVPLAGGREFKVAIIGGLQERETYMHEHFDFYAGRKKPGVAALNVDKVRKLVTQLREFDSNIFIILFPHWGRDYEHITGQQQSLAEEWKDMGINAVIGHGPHVMQPLHLENDRLTAFSIGNFIFNSPGRFDKKHADAYSLITKMIKPAAGDEVIFRFYPTFNNNRVVRYVPRMIGPAELAEVVEELGLKDDPRKKLGRDENGWFIEVSIHTGLNHDAPVVEGMEPVIHPMEMEPVL